MAALLLWLPYTQISAGAYGGPRSRVFAPLALPSAPHHHQRELFAAHVWKVTLRRLPKPQKKERETNLSQYPNPHCQILKYLKYLDAEHAG